MRDGPVLLTGVDHPLGLDIAEALIEDWEPVVIGGNDLDAVEGVLEHGSAVGLRTDPRDEFDIERLAETASRLGEGALSLVIPAARVRHGATDTPVYETSYAAIDDEVRTNLRGVYATIKETIPHADETTKMLIPVWDPKAVGGTYGAVERAIEQLTTEIATSTDLAVAGVDVGAPASDDARERAVATVIDAIERPLDDYDGRIFARDR